MESLKATQAAFPFLDASRFTACKQLQFLETLKPIQFSGQVVWASPKGKQWVFYLHLGYIMYATGGTHPVRRWQRNLTAYCQEMLFHIPVELSDLDEISPTLLKTCWQYQLLCLWVVQHKITQEQVTKIIQSIVLEVLFDLAQATDATYQIKPDRSLSSQLVLLKVQPIIADVQQLLQSWWKAQLSGYSPNQAPLIKQPEQLQKRTSANVYQTLTTLLDGRHTLRDIAVQIKRDVVQVTHSLLPYIRLGLVELINIPDLPPPIDASVPETPFGLVASTKPLVVCVDDDLWVCRTMETLILAAGYQFIGVNDGLRAISTMLTHRPNLIFLDLVIPNTNGYELCAQLRKLSFFRDTPIVILTGNDGIVDKAHAQLVKASAFLSKPVNSETVLRTIHKYLEQGVTSHLM
ncbi:MAG: response regulator [Coleofasciculus sp. S288]|nr:response regulator [Coleofasciculus sp. S288]